MPIRVRFAPSPTGHLHVGNVRTALYNWLFARQNRGNFVLRIEDTDLARSETHYEDQLLEDLRWLGLDWDEGIDRGGSYGPYRQTDRLALYRGYAEQLLESGQAYYCFCPAEELARVREQQLEEGRQPRYSGRCRSLDPREALKKVRDGEPAALRLKVRKGKVGFKDLVYGPLEVDCEVIGDFILVRSDGTAQYNFAVVIDDSLMRISHVIRGEGHVSNTHRQILLYEALGLEQPVFAHLSTILGHDGSKLSKRHGATSIDQFRSQGYLPEALVNYLALLGWAPKQEGREILTVEELVAEFDLAAVNRSPAVFDLKKLNWVNRSHLKQADLKRLVEIVLPALHAEAWIDPRPGPQELEWLEGVMEAVLGYLDKLEDFVEAARVVFDFDPQRDLKVEGVAEVLAAPGAVSVVEAFQEALGRPETVDLGTYKKAVQETKLRTGQKGKQLFHPIRVAITGKSSGPELDKLVPLLERGKALQLSRPVPGISDRVEQVVARLK